LAVQLRAIEAFPGVATRPVGAAGAVVSFGVTEAVAAVDRIPATSIATSVYVALTPLVRPVSVYPVADAGRVPTRAPSRRSS
jgi:hypothetical protein